jgi:surface polysaccharide O-acyltransferase-like enzyme
MTKSLESGNTDRLFFADAIRAVSIIAIVFLHVSSPVVQDFTAYRLSWWWIANVVYSCARPSIALFVMVSGLLLLPPEKEESMIRFFRKRLLRIAVPFLAWGTVYFYWKTHGVISLSSIMELVKEFIIGPVYYHLWFIYTIAGIYLAVPVFRVYVKHASRSNQAYLLILWFTGTALYPLIRHFTGFAIGIPVMVAGGFLGTFLLGNFLRDYPAGKKAAVPLSLAMLALLAFTAFATYYLSLRNSAQYDGTFEDFLSPNVIAAAVCLFLLMRDISFEGFKKRLPVVYNLITMISSASFSIYLMHILVLEILKGHLPWFSLEACTFHPLIGIPLTAVITLAFCLTVVLLMRKIPLMKYIFP